LPDGIFSNPKSHLGKEKIGHYGNNNKNELTKSNFADDERRLCTTHVDDDAESEKDNTICIGIEIVV
jgi:hypothetical protein